MRLAVGGRDCFVRTCRKKLRNKSVKYFHLSQNFADTLELEPGVMPRNVCCYQRGSLSRVNAQTPFGAA
ncbi:hypothetical protein ccbrp13_18490 [Ktedonobacteria bacterium brp13]|nr:hypothetical protein ccbrp13_18490 [Ktedonobacteria bacterium brp13]